MTYFAFLFLFIVPPIAALVWLARPTMRQWACIGVLALITYVWTTPWDNYLVASGVWAYRPEHVSGIVLGFVPVEEYLFFGLQAVLGSLWTLTLQRLARSEIGRPGLGLAAAAWLIGPLVATVSGVAGLAAVGDVVAAHAWSPLPFGQLNYLVLILVWAVPVIAGQWVIGRRVLARPLWVWAAGWIVPTLYLSASDAVAIAAGVWHILPAQSLNLMLPVGGGLPIEEGLFFLVTSMLVTQGFLLVSAPEAAATVRGWLGAANRQHEVRA